MRQCQGVAGCQIAELKTQAGSNRGSQCAKVRINGLKPNSRLRPVPGHTNILLTLEAVATQDPHYWLLDGKLIAQNQQKKTARFVLNSAGQHSIALIDSAGNHTSVDFWVDL